MTLRKLLRIGILPWGFVYAIHVLTATGMMMLSADL